MGQNLPPGDTEDQTVCVLCVRRRSGFRAKFCCAATGSAPISATDGSFLAYIFRRQAASHPAPLTHNA